MNSHLAARKLLDELGALDVPLDLRRLCKSLGIRLCPLDGDNVDAMFLHIPPSPPMITYAERNYGHKKLSLHPYFGRRESVQFLGTPKQR